MQAEMSREFRKQVGREEEPTAAIIDSRSVKTSEKGGCEDMMGRKRSREESGTSL